MNKKLVRAIFIIAISVTAIYLWDSLTPGLPRNFDQCMAQGGVYKKNVTENGVEDDPNKCVFAAKNNKQERICLKLGGQSRVGAKCPCCEITYQKK